ncbi:AraC family transcriptional regulator [Mycobacterium sp. 852002-51961_SCH5331710]|uniref:helix-turn-helix transcriptional regulator n=2 Tax=unclassified Mycobacterium TaxID=2642494 RepID=UPI0007FF87AC|nr:AraC family transcriptional regulator [Mycobacterium sp. 852002-51961_SCH5331710]OBB47606.1 AraC family transcriptional regulator [Mycobacterium sp. 852002-51961_SCH5331710]
MSNISTSIDETCRLKRSQVEISKPADAAEFLEDIYGVKMRLSHKAPPHCEGPILSHARATVGPLTLDEITVVGQAEIRPDPLNRVAVIWPTAGRIASACDGIRTEVAAGEVAMLAQPHLPHTALFENAHFTAVLIDARVAAGVAAGLPGSCAPLPIRFSSFSPVDDAAAQLWKNTVRYVKDSVLSDDSPATPVLVEQASRLMAAVTLETFPNTATACPSLHLRGESQPVLLRRAIEFMEANVHNDIALADIAEAVHVTPRAVQYMFRRHLATTPLQHLRRMRLNHAHQELLAAINGQTVTEIAARWGFAHTGRFAVLYRQTYGQSPHVTLSSA